MCEVREDGAGAEGAVHVLRGGAGGGGGVAEEVSGDRRAHSIGGPPGPVGCRGAMFVMVVVWVMLGVGAFVVWSVMHG